jgi:hypothetical protein
MRGWQMKSKANNIEKIFSEIKKELEAYQKPNYDKAPEAKYYDKGKNEGYISVTYFFGPFNDIKAKIKAPVGKWLKFLKDFEVGNVPFEVIEKYLSRPKRETKEALKKYAIEYPDNFNDDFFKCVWLAYLENPEYRPSKPRKSIYKLTKAKKWKIMATAIRLYEVATIKSDTSLTKVESVLTAQPNSHFPSSADWLSHSAKMALSNKVVDILDICNFFRRGILYLF